MAKTRKKKASVVPGRQAPTGAWAPETLLTALKSGTDQDKLAALKRAGILDDSGHLTKTYKNWGSKVTRTPDALDVKR